ncbi:hypothetical protein ACROYT_G031922 [Oculina patagonica]
MTIRDLNKAMEEAGNATFGYKRRKRNGSNKIEDETHFLLDCPAYSQLGFVKELFTNAERRTKRGTIRPQDKRDYIEKLAVEAKNAANLKDMKTLYQIAKKLTKRRLWKESFLAPENNRWDGSL